MTYKETLGEKIKNCLRVLKHLPMHYHENASAALQQRFRQEHGEDFCRWLYLDPETRLCCPDHAMVIDVWKRYHIAHRDGRKELYQFLELADGTKKLLDIGANFGIFGALYSNTRAVGHVLAVEPENWGFGILEQTAKANQSETMRWDLMQTFISDQPGEVNFSVRGNHAVISEEGESMSCHSLESLCEEKQFVPDLIKMDIEGAEYEALFGSVSWLESHKPRIFLELHYPMLTNRGLSPEKLVFMLQDIGYRSMHTSSIEKAIRKSQDSSGCSRLALVA